MLSQYPLLYDVVEDKQEGLRQKGMLMLLCFFLSCQHQLKHRASEIEQRAATMGWEIELESPLQEAELERYDLLVTHSEELYPEVALLQEYASRLDQTVTISGPPYEEEGLRVLREQLEQLEEEQQEQRRQEQVHRQKIAELEARARSVGWQLRIEEGAAVEPYVNQLDWVDALSGETLSTEGGWDRAKTEGWTWQDWKRATVEYWVELNEIRREVNSQSLAAVRAYLHFVSPYSDWVGFDRCWDGGFSGCRAWDGPAAFPVIEEAEKWIEEALQSPPPGADTVTVCGKKIPYYADIISLECSRGDVLSPLVKLPNLVSLSLSGVGDLSSLASLPGLTYLETDTAHGIRELQQIRYLDITPASLEHFFELAELTSLIELKLNLIPTRGSTDLQPLGRLKSLQKLELDLGASQSSNPITPTIEMIEGISVLFGLRDLTELKIRFVCTLGTNDLDGLRNLTRLRTLYLIDDCFMFSALDVYPSLRHFPKLQDADIPIGLNDDCATLCDEVNAPEEPLRWLFEKREGHRSSCEIENQRLNRSVDCKKRAWLLCAQSCSREGVIDP